MLSRLYPLETVEVVWPGAPYYDVTIHTRRPAEVEKQIKALADSMGPSIGCDFNIFTPVNFQVTEGFSEEGHPLHCLDEVYFNCTVGTSSYGKSCADLNEENREKFCLTETLGFAYACCECKYEPFFLSKFSNLYF